MCLFRRKATERLHHACVVNYQSSLDETSRPVDVTLTRRGCLCLPTRAGCDLGHMEDGAERGSPRSVLGPQPTGKPRQQRAAVVTEREPDPQLPTRLPRALRALAHKAVATEDEPHRRVRVEPTAQPNTGLILGGRATSVPFTAVLAGPERTTTDNHKASSTCAISHPRRWQQRPIWLWEQGVA
jgi:hypothetical protein